jgi:seryl-tRNA synthetase
MLDLKFVRENLDTVVAGLKRRGVDFDPVRFREIEEGRRKALKAAEDLKAEKNRLSQEVGKLKKAGQDASALMAQVKESDGRMAALETEAQGFETRLLEILHNTPNLPQAGVPDGLTAEQNVKVRENGTKPVFDFQPRPHWELGESLGILDWERAAKITGARFTVYRGLGAKLERALCNYMLDVQTGRNGYLEHQVPLMVNRDSMFGTTQIPKFENDMFRLEEVGYFLIPTAEVPLTNLRRNEVLQEAELPVKVTALSACFRKEAGAYGKDTKGMVRQHQFNKVELVKLTTPETSQAEHEKLTADAESILQGLKLTYRVMLLCAGDMGFGAAKCYDLEVYHPGTDKWWECSSCSNFEDFQARRANIKYKAKDGKTRLVHTLNGSGLATSRLLPAILENYQQKDGSVLVPEVLRPYLGGLERISGPV